MFDKKHFCYQCKHIDSRLTRIFDYCKVEPKTDYVTGATEQAFCDIRNYDGRCRLWEAREASK